MTKSLQPRTTHVEPCAFIFHHCCLQKQPGLHSPKPFSQHCLCFKFGVWFFLYQTMLISSKMLHYVTAFPLLLLRSWVALSSKVVSLWVRASGISNTLSTTFWWITWSLVPPCIYPPSTITSPILTQYRNMENVHSFSTFFKQCQDSQNSWSRGPSLTSSPLNAKLSHLYRKHLAI